MKKSDKNERFEDQLARLEEIVARLEDDSVGLEEALELFEGGMDLARRCRSRLEEVEQRVTQLLEAEEGESGAMAEPDQEEPA
ncbi:MAG: exodeoxyribonuclease VII small subunit [Thermoanaerobaculales bacterium]